MKEGSRMGGKEKMGKSIKNDIQLCIKNLLMKRYEANMQTIDNIYEF